MSGEIVTYITQVEFNQLYDKFRRYARTQAAKLFFDVALRDEAIDKAMDKVVDHFIEGRQMTESYIKSAIDFSLRKSRDRGKIEAVKLSKTEFNGWGWRGRRLKT